MREITPDTFLPSKPQFVRVELDDDMAGSGPLPGGRWPGRKFVLTYHFFPSDVPTREGGRKLKAGDRVCVNAGAYENCFGTVLGRAWRWQGYTFGVRRARTKTVTFQETVDRTAEFEVA